MRVLMLTPALDAGSPFVAFAVAWTRALAERASSVDVVCATAATPPGCPNVRVWPFAEATGRARRLVTFERLVARLAGGVDVVFAHMIPRYAWLAAPVLLARRKPMVLWYVHRQDSLELRAAAGASTLIATAVPSSFPFPTSKLRVIGHGVDHRTFAPDPARSPDTPPLVVSVGRLSPVKAHDRLLGALAALGPEWSSVRAVLAGAPAGPQDPAHAARLRSLARDLGIESRVEFAGALPPAAVVDLYRRATVAVNLSPDGLFDKAPLESLLAGTPTIVESPAFDALLGRDASGRPAGTDPTGWLTAELRRVLADPAAARAEVLSRIRPRVIAEHALEGHADRLAATLADAAR